MKGRLVHRSQLSSEDEEIMFSLFQKHFEGVPREWFRRDLDEKNWVILLDGIENGALSGFSTLDFYDTCYQGVPLSVVYSGDTIVDPAAWGSSALSRIWIGSVNHLRRTYSKQTLYWFLLVSGYRTYRFLPIFWRDFYPRCDAPTPPATQALMDFLAEERFGPLYHRPEGVVRFTSPQILREDLRGIPPGRLKDRHVAFFAGRNPGHGRGDELVCLTEISYDRLTPAGKRVWVAGEGAVAEEHGP